MLITASNCATFINGPDQEIIITSHPKGASIFIDDQKLGKTPMVLDLPRKGRFDDEPNKKRSYLLRIELDGYEPYETFIKRGINPWVWGNILSGSGLFIGLIVDATNGSMYRLKTEDVSVILAKNRDLGIKKSKNGSIFIATTLKIDPSWQKIGSLEKVKQ
jgi:PEGA domain